MPHVITNLCLREGSCARVCPVECITPGKPVDKYPTYYIDPDTCIDCGSCVAECVYSAIFPEEDVPSSYSAKGGEKISMPAGTPGYTEIYVGKNQKGEEIHLPATKSLQKGELVDLTVAIGTNSSFYKNGPGYKAS